MKKLLIGLFLLLSWVAFGQSSIQKNYFTTNDNPALSITNGNLVSTNIYVSNIFATNITVNNITNFNTFNGRTTITTNLFVTNAFISYLTNNTFYTTNVNETFVTNNLSYITNLYGPFITNDFLYTTNIFNSTAYITNLYGPFITNNTLYSTNIYVTNLTANYITNNTSYITNLYSSNIFTTNLYATNVYTTNLYSSNIFTTNLFATNIYTTNLYATNAYITNIFNSTAFVTNLYVSNSFFTNITVDVITNNTFITTNAFISNAFITNLTVDVFTNNTSIITNLYVSNVFATNITVDVITNNLFVTSNTFTTNLFVSNIFTTNITLMAAIWNTNKWNGPTNDVSFKSTYQKYVTSTDLEVTGFIDSSPSNANTSILLIDPGGANRTLYFPAPFTNYTSDGNNAYLIPSTNVALITLFQYGHENTNIVFRLFGPGTLGDTNFAYTDKSNAFIKTNYEALNFTTSTNLVWGPDFSVPESLLSTNAAFTMVACVGVDTTKKEVQWTLVNVTNTTATAVAITGPPNVHMVGTWYVTNWTAIWFQCYANAITNGYAIPTF